jgi:hypothetical protein
MPHRGESQLRDIRLALNFFALCRATSLDLLTGLNLGPTNIFSTPFLPKWSLEAATLWRPPYARPLNWDPLSTSKCAWNKVYFFSGLETHQSCVASRVEPARQNQPIRLQRTARTPSRYLLWQAYSTSARQAPVRRHKDHTLSPHDVL